jgi:hypothetical protein
MDNKDKYSSVVALLPFFPCALKYTRRKDIRVFCGIFSKCRGGPLRPPCGAGARHCPYPKLLRRYILWVG